MKSINDLGFDPIKLTKDQHDKIFLSYTQLANITGLNYMTLRVMQTKGQITEPYRFVSPHYTAHISSFFKRDEIDWADIQKRKDDVIKRSVEALQRQGYEVTLHRSPIAPTLGG